MSIVIGDHKFTQGTSEVIVSIKDGAVHRRFSDVSRPNEDLEDQGRLLCDKFTSLASPLIGGAKAREVIDLVACGRQRQLWS